jgi:hypothetical protein
MNVELEHKGRKKKPPVGAWGFVWPGEAGYDSLPYPDEPRKPKPEPTLHLVKPDDADEQEKEEEDHDVRSE